MSARLTVRAPRPARRSHAERTAETRRRVTAAVVESLAEVGYPRTTGAEIARRAGVSWGAIQHHFGDKNGILAAALQDSFDRFAAILGAPPDSGVALEMRVSEFVDRAWRHFASDHYRSMFQILLNLPPEVKSSWAFQSVIQAWREIWRRFFPEIPRGEREADDLMRYAISALSGLATFAILEGGDERAVQRGLALLKRTLVQELEPTEPMHSDSTGDPT